jgi:Fe2+ or Zn2+ uptake regulation protein
LTYINNWYKLSTGAKLQKDDIDRIIRDFELICRRRGMPKTVQRRVILETILHRDDHPTADQIHDEVKKRIPTISRTTVYRVLETLTELQIIRRLNHPCPLARYDGKTHRHHHFICRHCNKVVDFENAASDNLTLPHDNPEGFEIEDYSVHFVGICPACRKSGKQS